MLITISTSFVFLFSLSALADVLGALAERRSHIPYRNTKLTHVLQDTIGKCLSNTRILRLELLHDVALCFMNFREHSIRHFVL